MLFLLLAASLNLLGPAPEAPAKPQAETRAKAEAKPETKAETRTKAKAEAKPETRAEPRTKAKAVEDEDETPAAKPARRRLPSPVIPIDDPPVHPARIRRPVQPPPPSARAAVRSDPVVLEQRILRLEEDNAKLRMQLLLAGASAPLPAADPAAALGELMAGNKRFVTGTRARTLLTTDDPALREKLVKGDAPFAVLVTCSDSRLSENLLFDQELGRMFTIREAGNALDNLTLGSIEFALGRLGTRLVVVMGHVDCAAVQTVFDAHGKPLPGNLWALQSAMSGLLENLPDDPNEDPEVHLHRLVEANAQRQAQALLDRSAVIRDLVGQKKVQVVPAVYNPANGLVTFLPPVTRH